jgi:hypothetical protein
MEEAVWSEPVSEIALIPGRFWSVISWFQTENHEE